MPRTVSELLPRPFDELELADIEPIAEARGEERETLFLELKESLDGAGIAKACAAFANTIGGLLIVGVADDGTYPGIERPAGEPQLWVKDVLRSRVLPLPPYTARWLPLADGDDRGLLLILVEESSTTPHLRLDRGAIYVRNPGSSDPVPIQDQQRLLDLLRRGRQAQADAVARARALSIARGPEHRDLERLALVPTGTAATYSTRLFGPRGPELVRAALAAAYGELVPEGRVARGERGPIFRQHSVSHEVRREGRIEPRLDSVTAYGDGAVVLDSGYALGYEGGLLREQLEERFRRALAAGRELILELGGHGDLRIAATFDLRQVERVLWDNQGRRISLGDLVVVECWANVEPNEQSDDAVVADVFAELGRAGGIGPGQL